ncbi:MAG: B12-binding domain-containing radical SAM protein, partial [Lachnospiraceae bacterium]|nr:B12-binding domain-containing radical SAM protein [Lachnospiraceae bacterium]
MRFLLVAINAKYIHTNAAVYGIKSYIDENTALLHDGTGGRIDIAEFTINNDAIEILADIYQRKPDIIAFSCYIWNWETIRRLLIEIPKIMPSAPIFLGGPEVSYNGEEVLKRFPAVTAIVIGEGEQTCLDLFILCSKSIETDAIKLGLARIDGIVYRSLNNQINKTSARELLDLNILSFPYSELSGENLSDRIIYYESSRGCPFRCSYCLSGTSGIVRFKATKKIEEELSVILAHEVAQIKFVDRTFNINQEHSLAIWRFIRDHDNGITNFHFEIAADLLTDEAIEILKSFRPGLVQLEIGVQSTHAKTLECIKRRMDFAKVKKVVKALRVNRNVHLHLDLIAGLPYEDYETFSNSFSEVYALKAEKLQLGFLKVLPGTQIRQDAKEFGIVYEEAPPYQVLCTKWIDFSFMRRLHRIEDVLGIFYNTNQFTNTIAVLGRAFDNAFQMYEKLADFFNEKDYFRKTPARVFRYQALLDFAHVYDAKNITCYQELLTH